MSNHSEESDYEHIEVRRVGGNIGAEIGGVVAGTELADEVVRELRRALLRHRVVFLRGQHAVDADAHIGSGAIGQRLRGQHVFDFRRADAEAERAEGAIGCCVAVAAQYHHAWAYQPRLRRYDVFDPLQRVVDVV